MKKEQLKAKVYDLLIEQQKKQAEIQNLQQQIQKLTKEINVLENTDKKSK